MPAQYIYSDKVQLGESNSPLYEPKILDNPNIHDISFIIPVNVKCEIHENVLETVIAYIDFQNNKVFLDKKVPNEEQFKNSIKIWLRNKQQEASQKVTQMDQSIISAIASQKNIQEMSGYKNAPPVNVDVNDILNKKEL